MMDEVGNEDRNKHTTSRDSSEPVNLVTVDKHTESPTTKPKLQLATSNEEARLHLLYCLIHTEGCPALPWTVFWDFWTSYQFLIT